jgi:integrase
MATFNYKVRTGSNQSHKVYLHFSYGRAKQFRTSTGYSLQSVSNWDKKHQKIKTVLAEPNAAIYNQRLNELKTYFLQEYGRMESEGNPIDNPTLKSIFQTFEGTAIATAKKESKEFLPLMMNFIEASEDGSRRSKKGTKITKGTIKTYKTVHALLTKFQKEKGRIVFGRIDQAFYNRLVQFCEEEGYTTNYTGKIIKVLKTYLEYAVKFQEVKLSKNYDAKDFVVLKEDIDEIYLTNEELMKMYHLDLEAMSEKYCLARDLFLIGAYTGLRVSDYTKLSEKNIDEHNGKQFFKVIARKTGNEIIIPIAQIVHDIIDRNGGLPKTMPDQKLNQLIKEVGESAGIDETIIQTKTIGGKKVESKFMKFDLIQSHTARRSFCTNAYLGGLDTLSIMAVSGHKTESNFLKYIKVTKQEQADRIAEHPYFKSLDPDIYDTEGKAKLIAV